MKHFEVLRKWCQKTEIEIFDKWLISLDRVTYYDYRSCVKFATRCWFFPYASVFLHQDKECLKVQSYYM